MYYQTRIDKILEGRIINEMYPPSQFESLQILEPLIKKFGRKDADELRNEIIQIERSLKLMCYDFPKMENRNIDYLRKFVLLLKILNKIIEKSFYLLDFSFSWEDIISNLLHLENDPNLMIQSMIRELKRRTSYKARLLNRNDKSLSKNSVYSSTNKIRQKLILEFIWL